MNARGGHAMATYAAPRSRQASFSPNSYTKDLPTARIEFLHDASDDLPRSLSRLISLLQFRPNLRCESEPGTSSRKQSQQLLAHRRSTYPENMLNTAWTVCLDRYSYLRSETSTCRSADWPPVCQDQSGDLVRVR